MIETKKCVDPVVLVVSGGGGLDNGLGLLPLAEDALLQVPQGVVLALFRHQLIVGTLLHNAAFIHHDDLVTAADGGQAVGDDQHRTVGQLIMSKMAFSVAKSRLDVDSSRI